MTSNRKKTKTVASGAESKGRQKPQEGMRETIEAVAIAFILAFVFKTFEAEAFVIPTGSMAPTLYGRHKEVTCEGCKLAYTIGASQEIDQETGILQPSGRIATSTCPNCRFENSVTDAPVFNGDRIVVNKQVARFERFNVVVFKNPEEPNVNYIKRLIGLPGETVRIQQGNIFARAQGETEFRIQRKKDPEVQRDIQLLVYDDHFPATPLLELGAEERWVPAHRSPSEPAMGGWSKSENAWQPNSELRSYSADAPIGDLQWLRYRHLIPGDIHWNAAKDGTGKPIPAINPQLIADFCGFNETSVRESRQWGERDDDMELYWVDDLTVELTVDLQSSLPDGKLVIELEEGVRAVRLVLTPATGLAEIVLVPRNSEADAESGTVLATATTDFRDADEYELVFSNVDDRACVWIDGQLIEFGEAVNFAAAGLNLPAEHDLAPVGIAVSGIQASVADLLIRRDIYYRNDVLDYDQEHSEQGPAPRSQYPVHEVPLSAMNTLSSNLRTPANYARAYAELTEAQNRKYSRLREYPLDDDEYMMFGDNSPASQDSRLFDYWSRPLRGVVSHRYAVRQQDLIGEALWIFWPHGVPFLNDGKGYSVLNHKKYDEHGRVIKEPRYPLYSAPFYPNLSRMKVIR